MSKNKLVIDLRRLTLTDNQNKSLRTAIHNAVVTQLKKINSSTTDKSKSELKKPMKAKEELPKASTPANLTVTFTNTEPGDSKLTAILNGEKQKITESGTITFKTASSGNIIIIQGESLGTTTITIDISADPTQMNFPPGHFNDNFFIN